MNIKTQEKYRKSAEHFYRVWMGGGPITSARIRAALLEAATHYVPGSFRILKNALAFDQRERGYPQTARDILNVRNPVTLPGSAMTKKPKRKRAKAFSRDDVDALVVHLFQQGFIDEVASLTLAWYCGVRPCEMRTLQVIGNSLHVAGGKKSHEGKRGADRVMEIEDPEIRQWIANMVTHMSKCLRTNGAIRDRFRSEVRKLWPRRKVQPSLYSLRHQFGSNLKASGSDAKVLAYLMGQQSTVSIEQYGDRRKGDKALIKVAAPKEVFLGNIRTGEPKAKPWLRPLDRFLLPDEPCA